MRTSNGLCRLLFLVPLVLGSGACHRPNSRYCDDMMKCPADQACSALNECLPTAAADLAQPQPPKCQGGDCTCRPGNDPGCSCSNQPACSLSCGNPCPKDLTCERTSVCAVSCAGACLVHCNRVASCSVTCAAGNKPKQCDGNVVVCERDCPGG